MRIQLRDYQDEAVAAVKAEVANKKNPLCVLPTGSGKSLVLAALLLEGQPALVLSHVKELLEQDSAALTRMGPHVEQSFYAAGLKQKDPTAFVVFGSVQSVYQNLDAFRIYRPRVFVDEAHLCPRKAEAMYATVFSHFAAAQRIGLTATPSRMDSGSLHEGAGAWFDCIAYSKEPGELIAQGYLVPLTGLLPQFQADLAGVATRGGEYAFGEAEQAVIKTLSLHEAVQSAKEHAKDRKSWLVFAAGLEHADKVLQALRDEGVSAECVTSKTPDEERSDTIDRFKAGEFRALVNVGVLTTGFDAPLTDCILSLRPTKSKVLWQQMLGRGMRIAEGKSNCLLLDFVGNLDRLGGVGVVQEKLDLRNPDDKAKAKKIKKGRGPQREDPALQSASTADPMLTGQVFSAIVNKTSYFTVNSKRYPGKKILVGVYDLQDEFGRALSARTFICIEYQGGARYHAEKWFVRRGVARSQIPDTADKALVYARALQQPTEVEARYDRGLSCFLVERERFAELTAA